jgi:hypothetical protein
VVTADSPSTGLAVLTQLASNGEDVALIAADLRLPGMNSVAFLEQAHELHRDASRVLLLAMDRYHTRIPFTDLATLQRATGLGRIDFWVVKGWVTPEEWLYPQVQEALSAWTITHRPHHVVYRIVGEQWAPRSHDLREVLSRNGVPFAFYPVDSRRDNSCSTTSQSTQRSFRPSSATTVQCCTIRASPRLPAHTAFKYSLALTSTIWRFWVPDQPGWQPQCMELPKVCTPW